MEQNFGCHNCMYATGCPLHELVVKGEPLTHEAINSITTQNASQVLQRTHSLPFGAETSITTILTSNKTNSKIECTLLREPVRVEVDPRNSIRKLSDSLLRFSGRFAHTFWQNGKYLASSISEMIPRKAYYKGVTFAEWLNDTDCFHNRVNSYLDLMKITSLTDNLAIGNIDAEEFSSGKEIHRVAAYPFRSERLIRTTLEDGNPIDFDSFFELHTIRRSNNIANLRSYSLIQLSDIKNFLIDIKANIEDPRMPNVVFVNGPVHITKPLKKFGFKSVREIGDDKNLTRMKLKTGEADTLVFAVNVSNVSKAIKKISSYQIKINRLGDTKTKPYTQPLEQSELKGPFNATEGSYRLQPDLRKFIKEARRAASVYSTTNDEITDAIRQSLVAYGCTVEEIDFIFNNNLHT